MVGRGDGQQAGADRTFAEATSSENKATTSENGSMHWPACLCARTPTSTQTLRARLADRYGLSLYDALYLNLAQRRGIPLATLDKTLRGAAIAESVVVVQRGT